MTSHPTTGDLLRDKIAYGFDHLDRDGDGRLTEADHVLMGRDSARSLGHPAGSPEEHRIVEAYLHVWRELHLPRLPEGSEEIGREEFIAGTLGLAEDPAAARATVGALAEVFLSVADTDGNGVIDPDEFHAFQRGHFPALDRETSDLAFSRLDRDGNGTLSREEFVQAVVEYWSSRDPEAPGNWWTGNPAFAR
ncbi:EF-hand domain-containing protein [Kitasatospora sp. NPDC051853]|uniref:EF-hand domain-containing protein n=1 Tax=Kitasatospora sp. NPDC051853 TaxID=3364058 RepID=UPI0037930A4B